MDNVDNVEYECIEISLVLDEKIGLKWVDDTFSKFLFIYKDCPRKLKWLREILDKRLSHYKACDNPEYSTMYEGLVKTVDSCL